MAFLKPNTVLRGPLVWSGGSEGLHSFLESKNASLELAWFPGLCCLGPLLGPGKIHILFLSLDSISKDEI